MSYSSQAVVFMGYPINIENYQTELIRCPKSKSPCPLIKDMSPFCSLCGEPISAIRSVKKPDWFVFDLDHDTTHVVGLYKCFGPNERYFVGVILGVSESEQQTIPFEHTPEDVQRIKDWMRERSIRIEGEPRLFVHLYESY